MSVDKKAFNKIGYGLYVVTSREGDKDNALIVNTVCQVSSEPLRISVCINKQNYSHDMIKNTGKMNVNCLGESAPFEVFTAFGFRSGRDTDKMAGVSFTRSENGIAVLTEHVNAFMSLEVEQYIDLGSHGMFICSVSESAVTSGEESMTYAYYHAHVKPKKPVEKKDGEQTGKKKGYVCRICGWVYEGETLPPDIVCPICKHGAEDFEEIK